MALPPSGTISLNDIHVEAGGTSGTLATINDADIRGLIGKAESTTMSFSEWYGANSGPSLIDMYIAESTNNNRTSYTWTNTKSVQAGDLVVLFWVSGYASQSDSAWTVNGQSMSNAQSNQTNWIEAYEYTKHNAAYAFITNSASSLSFATDWSSTIASGGITAIVAIVRGATSCSGESSQSVGSHDVTSQPALGLAASACNGTYGPPFVDWSAPSVEETSVRESSSTRDYHLEVSALYATAGDVANGYFNLVNRFTGSSTSSLGVAVTIY
jgi:hypothetical protein